MKSTRLQPPTAATDEAEHDEQTALVGGEHIDFRALLSTHHKYSTEKQRKHSFGGEVLTYITPWNGKGYDMAKIMKNKIDWLVPVWFQLRRNSDDAFEIGGEHDVDEEWLESVRSSDASSEKVMKIVPRVIFEAHVGIDVSRADSGGYDEVILVADLLTQLAAKYNFQGFTLEISPKQLQLTVGLSEILRKKGLSVVYVLPAFVIPPDNVSLRNAFAAVAQSVDRISLNTYDNSRQGAHNAPLPWVRDVLTSYSAVPGMREKLLMGCPMYGWDTLGNAITGEAFISWVATHVKTMTASWDATAQEHIYSDGVKSSSYPSLYFLKLRLQLASEMGIPGVALWEIGQMIPIFADVF